MSSVTYILFKSEVAWPGETDGFVITADAHTHFIQHNAITPELQAIILDGYRFISKEKMYAAVTVSFDRYSYNCEGPAELIRVLVLCFRMMKTATPLQVCTIE